jgi:hypothetical protein
MGWGSGRLHLQTIYGTTCCNVQLVQNIDDTDFFNLQTYQVAKFNKKKDNLQISFQKVLATCFEALKHAV